MEEIISQSVGNKYKTKCVFKSVTFMLIFIVLLSLVSRIMTVNSSNMEYQLMTGIYGEEENSLDAVYLGSSDTYAFWNPLVAFEGYGICVYQYNCSSQPITVAEDLIKEARKTQPDAVYIIPINTLGNDGLYDTVMHRLLDYMPLSTEKLKMTKWMVESEELSFSESLEYYFPLLRYHSRWNELVGGNFARWDNNIKNSSTYSTYLSGIEDISKNYKTSNEKAEISEFLEGKLDSLLNYLEKENIKAIFVTVPRAEESMTTVKRFNTVNEIISSRGFSVIDLMEKTSELGIDTTTDYYNNTHTNIHGSIKFTNYLSEYLIETYKFEDKRENPDYNSWKEALSNYYEKIEGYTLDFELDSDSRDYSLSMPKEISAEINEENLQITWKGVSGADGYAVYRKENDKWSFVGKTENCTFTDVFADDENSCIYTVVPYTEKDNQTLYGNFSYTGVPVKEAEK